MPILCTKTAFHSLSPINGMVSEMFAASPEVKTFQFQLAEWSLVTVFENVNCVLETDQSAQKLIDCPYIVFSIVLYCIVNFFLQKLGAMQLKINAICKHLKAFPSLQLGDRKNPHYI